jgi:hypothetical protein
MPDAFGFDHLGDRVQCVKEGCTYGGKLWQLRLTDRRAHWRGHERERARERRAREQVRKRSNVKRLRLFARLRRETRRA